MTPKVRILVVLLISLHCFCLKAQPRDSINVFLEMIVIGKGDKLLQLAKTDKNIMGKQLASLLSMDFATEKGRAACHKNAFALLRLQRLLLFDHSTFILYIHTIY